MTLTNPFEKSNLVFTFTYMIIRVLALCSTNVVRIWIIIELLVLISMPLLLEITTISNLKNFFILQIRISILILRSLWTENSLQVCLILWILVKTGLPPFHSWFIELRSSLSLTLIYLFTVVRKFPSLSIIMLMEYSLTTISRLSGIISLISILLIFTDAQFNIKKTIILLSFTNTAWLLLSSQTESSTFLLNYAFISYLAINDLCSCNTNKLNLGNIISLFSLIGVPPLAGFFLKLRLIQRGIINPFLLLAIFANMLLLFITLKKTNFSLRLKKISLSSLLQILGPYLLLL